MIESPPCVALVHNNIIQVTWNDANILTRSKLFFLDQIKDVQLTFVNDPLEPFIVSIIHTLENNRTEFQFWNRAIADQFMLKVFQFLE